MASHRVLCGDATSAEAVARLLGERKPRTPAQVKAFRILVNRSVTWADWDEELLALELQELKESDFDLAVLLSPPRGVFPPLPRSEF